MRPQTKTQRQIAKEIGISTVWLNKIVRGNVPGFRNIPLARKIEAASQGKYKAVDLIPDLRDFVVSSS